MLVHVKEVQGQFHQVTVDGDWTVAALKTQIARQANIETAKQRLLNNGRLLKDDHTLSHYSVGDGDCVIVVTARDPPPPLHAAKPAANPFGFPNIPQAQQAPQNQDAMAQMMMQQLQNALAGANAAAQGNAPAAAPQAAPTQDPVDEMGVVRLMEMGLTDEDSCRQALRQANNDVDLAVAYILEEMGMD